MKTKPKEEQAGGHCSLTPGRHQSEATRTDKRDCVQILGLLFTYP